jgi:protein-disulfide isomerase
VNSLRQTQSLLRQAGRNKTDVGQVRNWIAEALKAAQPYGPRFENEVAVQIAEALASHSVYSALAVENAQRAERALTAKDSADQQLRVLDTLALALKTAGKPSDAGAAESRAAKVTADLDREYLATMPPFKPETYEGRKEKSDRAVVLELFTGAQCPPCVASDVAFDALEKTYKPTDVVLVQYHLHIPGADPMTNATTEARARYYSVSSTPSTFFNGERNASGGGAIAQAQRKYTQFRGILDDLLEKPSGAGLKLGAALQGDTITVKADVSKLADPSDDKKLRFVLVEETVRFIGNNKLRYHHMVVRAMPGGVDGIALTKADGEHSARVNLSELRQELTAYLDDYAVNGRRAPFPQPERPLALKGLKAIALVQDDKTKEILQAAIIDVDGVHAAH